MRRTVAEPAGVDRLAEGAIHVGKDDDVANTMVAYRSREPRCGCEVVAEVQDYSLRGAKDCDFDLEHILGRSRCRHLKASYTYPWVAAVVLQDLAVGRSWTYQVA